MSELRDKLEREVKRIINEQMPEIETDGIFDQSTLDSAGYPLPPAGSFFDDPLAAFADRLIGGMEKMMPARLGVFTPPLSEHKVKIFRLHDRMSNEEKVSIGMEIETLLNDGYCCHMPTVCNDFLIMDFSRRKETEENEREQQ